MSSIISTRRVAIRLVIAFLTMSLGFFGSAGTFAWPEAWLYTVFQFTFSTTMAIWLKRNNPDLLKERMALWKKSARAWDKAILLVSTCIFVPYLFLPGLDAVRYQWSSVPLPFKGVGFAGIIAAFILLSRVIRENSFLSRVVEIQLDRGHKVITTGPYRYVRHPMYAGAISLFLCIPIALGSLWTLIPGSLLAAIFIVRTHLEDKTLHKELSGYPSYAAKVRFKLVPGIW